MEFFPIFEEFFKYELVVHTGNRLKLSSGSKCILVAPHVPKWGTYRQPGGPEPTLASTIRGPSPPRPEFKPELAPCRGTASIVIV